MSDYRSTSNKANGQHTLLLHGLASVNKDDIDNSTLEMVSAGDQLSFKMSRQIWP